MENVTHQDHRRQGLGAGAADSGWDGFYPVAGAGVALSVGLILLDFALTFSGGDVASGSLTAEAWFAFFERSPFVGLRNFGLYNVVNPLLMLPLYLALYHLHRKAQPAFAALALALFLVGSGVYIANNQALGMLALSQHYAAAEIEAQRAQHAAAGTVLLAQAEYFTPGAFPGFFLSSLGNLAMIAVMLRGGIFSRRMPALGLAGSACLLGFTICVTFIPGAFDAAMLAAMIVCLLMLAWNIWMSASMFRMRRQPADQPGQPAARTIDPSPAA